MSQRRREPTNLELLDQFWRRSPFHDESIQEVIALNRRVVIRLERMTLVITGATGLTRCDLPCLWLDQSVVPKGDRFVLDVETDDGHLIVAGQDIRLIRNSDLAVLIPPLDA
ncbi:hypothetical protein TA3x_004035 [Tundrisphaera sp. TA3]|uniref:hypothetical protein n=1 Tax=Tundrisphaera sp. TA3 TaxID=3435775 RepID=UPI003EBB5BBD